MRKFFFLSYFLISVFHCYSQNLPGAFDALRLLKYDNQLPKDLLSSRSVVFIDVPDKPGKLPERDNWQEFARQAHDGFVRMGIDAVGYYHLDDLNSGLDAKQAFIAPLDTRKIKNLIFLTRREGLLGSEVELVITARKEDGQLLSLDQKAYRVNRNAIGEIIAQLGRDVYQAKMVNRNFLILDEPEFFEDTDAVRGRRYESFSRDLRISKLAVPKFSLYQFPQGIDSSQVSASHLRIISDYNQQVEAANLELESILAAYPYKWELVDYSEGEEHLYRREFSFVLMHLNTSGKTVRKLLNYPIDPTETDYMSLKTISAGITTLEQMPVNTPVFKYYMKQLVNKEIYLGNQWDADLTWQEALTNYLNNLNQALEGEKE